MNSKIFNALLFFVFVIVFSHSGSSAQVGKQDPPPANKVISSRAAGIGTGIPVPNQDVSAQDQRNPTEPAGKISVQVILSNKCQQSSQVTIEYRDASGAFSACLISAEKSSTATCEVPVGKLNWSADTFIHPRQFTVALPAENPAQMDVTFGSNCTQFDLVPSATAKGGKPSPEPVAVLYGIPVFNGQPSSPYVFTSQEIAVMKTTLAPIPPASYKKIKKIISQLPFGDKAPKDFEFTSGGTLILYLPDLKYRLKNSGEENTLTFTKIENALAHAVGAIELPADRRR